MPDDSSSEEPHITEPERIEIKQRHVSHDSDEKPPKAKAKARVRTKKSSIARTLESNWSADGETAEWWWRWCTKSYGSKFKWSDNSFADDDGTFVHTRTAGRWRRIQYTTIQAGYHSLLRCWDGRAYHHGRWSWTPQLEWIGWLNSQPYGSEFVQFEGDYFVNLGHNSAAPDFKSCDINSFRLFCQYLAKNGKKTPQAESVTSTEICKTDQAS